MKKVRLREKMMMGCTLPSVPWSCKGCPVVSWRSWLGDKVNLFPWNCRVTGVSGCEIRLCVPAMLASWAIFTTSPPSTEKKADTLRKRLRAAKLSNVKNKPLHQLVKGWKDIKHAQPGWITERTSRAALHNRTIATPTLTNLRGKDKGFYQCSLQVRLRAFNITKKGNFIQEDGGHHDTFCVKKGYLAMKPLISSLIINPTTTTHLFISWFEKRVTLNDIENMSQEYAETIRHLWFLRPRKCANVKKEKKKTTNVNMLFLVEVISSSWVFNNYDLDLWTQRQSGLANCGTTSTCFSVMHNIKVKTEYWQRMKNKNQSFGVSSCSWAGARDKGILVTGEKKMIKKTGRK